MLKARDATAQEIAQTGLNHRVYLPENHHGRPVVVLVHGRAGNSRVMWTFSRVFEHLKPITVSPEGFLNDPAGGHSWWLVEKDESEPSRSKPVTKEQLYPAVNTLEQFILSLEDTYGADLDRIYAFGFSQGAAMITSLSLKRPQLFRSVGMLAGFVPKVAVDKEHLHPSVVESGKVLPPYFMAAGTEDKIIPLSVSYKGRDFLTELGASVEFKEEPVGHKVGAQAMRDLKQWFSTVWGEEQE